jgi:uroporphyrinogen-III decarboxylase
MVSGFDVEMASLGQPNLLGGFTKAPFDMIGDTLRGTTGIMTDMFRQPDKLLHALEALTPVMISMGLNSARQTGNPLIFMPLHNGCDGFLSEEHFKKFYWPSLQAVIVGLIEGGCVPFPAAEGGFNSRLEIIKDIPKGKTLWMLDQTDMIRAKKIVGSTLCMLGNVHSTLLEFGMPQEVTDYVKLLIDKVAPGGGFVLANGAFFDKAKPENLHAMIETARTYS